VFQGQRRRKGTLAPPDETFRMSFIPTRTPFHPHPQAHTLRKEPPCSLLSEKRTLAGASLSKRTGDNGDNNGDKRGLASEKVGLALLDLPSDEADPALFKVCVDFSSSSSMSFIASSSSELLCRVHSESDSNNGDVLLQVVLLRCTLNSTLRPRSAQRGCQG
jgi:hypothetical protein